jgi:hypothetical protein
MLRHYHPAEVSVPEISHIAISHRRIVLDPHRPDGAKAIHLAARRALGLPTPE